MLMVSFVWPAAFVLNTDSGKQAARCGSPQFGAETKPPLTKSANTLTARHTVPVNAMPGSFHFAHPVHFLGAAAAARLSEMKPENLSLDQRARHAAEAMACLAAAPVAMVSQTSSVLDGGPALVVSTASSQASQSMVEDSVPLSCTTSASQNQQNASAETTSVQSQMDKYSGYDRHFKKKFFGSERRARCDSAQKDERTTSESTAGTVSEDPRETTPTASPDSSGWENLKVSSAGAMRPSSRNDCLVSPAVVCSSSASSVVGGPVTAVDSMKAKHAVPSTSAARSQTECGATAAVTSRAVNRASPAVCSSPLPVDTSSAMAAAAAAAAAHLSTGFCIVPSHSTAADGDRRGVRVTPVANCVMSGEHRDRMDLSSTGTDSEHSLPRRSSAADLTVGGSRCDVDNSDDNR
jgi:hypothetical protein